MPSFLREVKKKNCGNPDFSKMSAERFCFLQALTTTSQLQCQVPLVMQGDVEGDESQERDNSIASTTLPGSCSPVPCPQPHGVTEMGDKSPWLGTVPLCPAPALGQGDVSL